MAPWQVHRKARARMSPMPARFELSVLSGAFVVTRLPPSVPVPSWALGATGFVTVTRTDDELSIICNEHHVPPSAVTPVRWHALKVHGPFPFETIGVVSALAQALANAKVSLLAISTHDTDYLFVRSPDLAHAIRALRHDGHTVHTPLQS
jgi:hypothetical protein